MKTKEFLKFVVASVLFWMMTLFDIAGWKKCAGGILVILIVWFFYEIVQDIKRGGKNNT